MPFVKNQPQPWKHGAPVGNENHLRHGRRYTPEWTAWTNAKQRVTNHRLPSWHRYGGRGIEMCAEWMHSFEAFLRDVGPRPSPELSLDRIDNDGNYEPGNVRWATVHEQARNRGGR